MAIGTGRSRHAGELVERWLEWRQQVRPISPVTVANYRGAIDRYILPNLGRAKVGGIDAATLDTLYARVRATGGKCRHCWKRIRRGEPALRAGVRSGATSTPAAGEVPILSGVVRVAGQPLIDKDIKTHAKRRVAVGAETIELLKAHRARQAQAALAAGATLPPGPPCRRRPICSPDHLMAGRPPRRPIASRAAGSSPGWLRLMPARWPPLACFTSQRRMRPSTGHGTH
jgi:hypothetical protein